MIFVLILLLKNVIYLDVYKSECNQSCLQAGVRPASLPGPFSLVYPWTGAHYAGIVSSNMESLGKCHRLFFYSGKSSWTFFFFHYSHFLSFFNFLPLCLLWESAKSSTRWQKPSCHLCLMKLLGMYGCFFFSPKLETCCECRCLLSPCLMS